MVNQTMFRCVLFLVVLMGLGSSVGACSVLDGGDRSDLEEAIDKEPTDVRSAMASMAMRHKAQSWLRGRPQNERVVGVECWHWTAANPTPTEPRIEDDLVRLVSDVVGCMNGGFSYVACLEIVSDDLQKTAIARWKAKRDAAPTGSFASQTETQCIEVTDQQFLPKNVPGGDEDYNRVAAGEIVEWLLSLPAPPPGFSTSAWGPLLPLICALGASWGCPGDPANPILIGTSPSGSTGGDP